MAVYEEKGGYEDWAIELDKNFGKIVDECIDKYKDKSTEELSYVMCACVHHRLLSRMIGEK